MVFIPSLCQKFLDSVEWIIRLRLSCWTWSSIYRYNEYDTISKYGHIKNGNWRINKSILLKIRSILNLQTFLGRKCLLACKMTSSAQRLLLLPVPVKNNNKNSYTVWCYHKLLTDERCQNGDDCSCIWQSNILYASVDVVLPTNGISSTVDACNIFVSDKFNARRFS